MCTAWLAPEHYDMVGSLRIGGWGQVWQRQGLLNICFGDQARQWVAASRVPCPLHPTPESTLQWVTAQ